MENRMEVPEKTENRAGKESTTIDLGSVPGSGRSTGEGIGYPLLGLPLWLSW